VIEATAAADLCAANPLASAISFSISAAFIGAGSFEFSTLAIRWL
jgi:hypothetical protein